MRTPLLGPAPDTLHLKRCRQEAADRAGFPPATVEETSILSIIRFLRSPFFRIKDPHRRKD
jgi:hypothetical protein